MSERVGFSLRRALPGALLFWGVAAMGAMVAEAQTYQTFDTVLSEIDRTTKWNLGPFLISSYFQIRNIGYDSNIYHMPKDLDPVSDYTASVGLPTKVSLNYRNWLLISLAELPEYAFYATQKHERSFNNDFVPELRLRLFHSIVLAAGYEYSRARRRPTSEFDVRAEVQTTGYRGSVFLETARQTAIGFSGSVEDFRYVDVYAPEKESSVSRRLDRQEKQGSLEFYYRLYSDTIFFLSGGYTEYDFRSPTSFYRNSYSYQMYSGIRFPLTGRIRGNVNIGYKKLVPRTRGLDGFSGLVGNTSFDLRLSRFLFRAFYMRDSVFSFWESTLYFVDGLWGGGISYYPSTFLRLDYDFRWGESSYPESVILAERRLQAIRRNDSYRIHTVSIIYRIINDTGIGLTGNFWQRTSNLYQFDRSRFFIGALLTYEF